MRPALVWLAGLRCIAGQTALTQSMCVDDQSWTSWRGPCSSYQVGQRNNAYCAIDGAVAGCPVACQVPPCGQSIPQGGPCSVTTNNNCAPGFFCKQPLITQTGTCAPRAGPTCTMHSQCSNGQYCFSCFTCQRSVGYDARASQCGSCFDNPLSPKSSGCAVISACASRKDSITGSCPTSTLPGVPSCGSGTTWCPTTSSCLDVNTACGVAPVISSASSSSGAVAYAGGITQYSGAQMPIMGQKDSHGCRNGMGEFWCESTQTCLYATVTCIGIPGQQQDWHGCYTAQGQIWCPAKTKCLNPAQEQCPPLVATGGPVDPMGCPISQGYFWCALLGRCISPAFETCASPFVSNRVNAFVGGQTDNGGCLIAAGYSWCDFKNKCLRVWEEACAPDVNPVSQLQNSQDPAQAGGCPNGGEEYRSCSSMCEPVCGQPAAACPEMCGPPKCQCRDGWSRLNGVCVLSSECPSQADPAGNPSVSPFSNPFAAFNARGGFSGFGPGFSGFGPGFSGAVSGAFNGFNSQSSSSNVWGTNVWGRPDGFGR